MSTELAHSTLFIALFLVVTAVLLIVITQLRQHDFVDNQQRLMASMTRSTANEISLLVDKYRNAVALFAEDHADLLYGLMDDPNDESRLLEMQQRVKRHFPQSFGITLARPNGDVVLDDFDGIVGEVCVRDLQAFARSTHPYEIFVHPHAEVYHFDMPVRVTLPRGDLVVFFVSFRLDEVARLLHSGAPPGHQFLLVNANDQRLIEVTEQGSRGVLGEAIRLTDVEWQGVAFQRPVEGTGWTLLDISSSSIFSDHLFRLYQQSILIYLLLLAGSFFALRRLRREAHRRRQAEQILLEKNSALTESNEQLREAQKQLVEAEKMASLGGLVAGIAHEINTPLGTAVTAVSTLREEGERTRRLMQDSQLKKSDFEHFLEVTQSAGELTEANLSRAAELVRSFKQVAVDQSSERRRRFQLCEYVDEILVSLRPRLNSTPHQIDMRCHQAVEIESYPGAISQIVSNLVLNSLQHAFTDQHAGRMQIEVDSRADMAILVYQDNGRGIAANERQRIFEPFFTTARNRGGSGLGLSIVYNLVVQLLQGQIDLGEASHPGFKLIITIPVRIDSASTEQPTGQEDYHAPQR